VVIQVKGGTTAGKLRPRGEHPGGVPELRVRPLDQAQTPVWHPSWVHDMSCTDPEVAAPKNPRRPPATLWQPFGLTKPECPNSSVRHPCLTVRAASSPLNKVRLAERCK